jgi:formate dehydrogenase major subunit
VGDNPLLFAPDSAGVRAALESLDLLIVVDSVMTDTAELAQIVLPDVDVYGKEGTYTPADRRVLHRTAATGRQGAARPALETLAELGTLLGAVLGREVGFADAPSRVMDEIATLVPLYEASRYADLITGDRQQQFDGAVPATALQSSAESGEADVDVFQLALITGRTLYTSIEATALHKPDADKLHREDAVQVSLDDARRLGIDDGDQVTIATDRGEVTVRASVTDTVPAGAVFMSLLYDGGAVTSLLPPEEGEAPLARVTLRVPARV